MSKIGIDPKTADIHYIEAATKIIYNLKPFEITDVISGMPIRRVPGGWLMETSSADGNMWTPAFVPMCHDLQDLLDTGRWDEKTQL